MKRGLRSVITYKVIHGVFDTPLANRFKDSCMARSICEMRENGMLLDDIGKRYGISPTKCSNIIRKAVLLYSIYGEEA